MFDLEAKHAAHNYKPLPVALERGECLFVWDVNVRRYLAYSAVNHGDYENFMTNLFGYDKRLPMNSGVESCESGLKLAQRWAYDVKNVMTGLIFYVWFQSYPYDDPGALEQVVLSTNGSNVAAFMVEPIQGEAGVRVAKDGGYSRKVAEICQRYNVLLIVDDVQTGLGRIGKRLCSDSENVRPDFLIFETYDLPSAMVKAVRGKGLLNAIEISSGYDA
ncbi:putative ornithine aminotransferase, mitochondrial [Trichinella britovi]|uniref:Ornithine aminotransferase n=1 Tax=Trichinella britovi TaxID=45882 RepID=A0A0V1C806_TRIBR|nr:putative ornithine aminotransferase, mitochondrial [Trichinella britovi]